MTDQASARGLHVLRAWTEGLLLISAVYALATAITATIDYVTSPTAAGEAERATQGLAAALSGPVVLLVLVGSVG